MPPRKDYTGQKCGMLTALRPDPENPKKWIFHCDCGTEKSIRPNNVFSDNARTRTVSCGCLNDRKRKESKNVKDQTGKTFGELTVLRLARIQREAYWLCQCSCGSLTEVRGADLTSGNTVSCGCRERKAQQENSEKLRERVFVAGTHTGNVRRKKPNKGNKSGHRGVWHDEVRGVYVAYITFQGKRRTIGRYKELADAVEARQKAEEERDQLLWETINF